MENLTLGEKIRRLRVEKEISLRGFAGRACMSHSFLSDIECGNRSPSEPVLKRIAKELGVKVTDLREFDARHLLSEVKNLFEQDSAWAAAIKRLTGAARDGSLTPDGLLRKLKNRK